MSNSNVNQKRFIIMEVIIRTRSNANRNEWIQNISDIKFQGPVAACDSVKLVLILWIYFEVSLNIKTRNR